MNARRPPEITVQPDSPSGVRSLGSEPYPTSGRPSGPSKTAWTPSPVISVDLGSSTPLQAMCEV